MTKAEKLIRENIKIQKTVLDLGNCGLKGTESELELLKDCDWLETLIFSNSHGEKRSNPNNLICLPPCLPKGLKRLNASGGFRNHFEIKDVSHLSNLADLVSLSLNYNRLSNITPLLGLTGLDSLELIGNQLVDISPLSNLTRLIKIFLGGNRVADISPLSVLRRLSLLSVWKNHITNITPLSNLAELTDLYLNENKLSNISLHLLDNFPKLKKLWLHKNPIKNIPQEIFNKAENVLQPVRDYLQSVARGEEQKYLNEAKLLIVGVGEVGKTEIAEALSNPEYMFDEKRETTRGINIKEWHIPCLRDGEKQDFRANIWDFAGQEINYGTHQFFLTKNSVYVFLWETRKGETESKFDYWLNVVSLLSDNAPIFVVQNKIDIIEGELHQKEWKSKYPHIVGFYKTSCKTGAGIARLQEDIQNALTSLPNTHEIWNKYRYDIRRILEMMQEDFIEYRTYLQICTQNTLNKEQAGFLAKQLHDIGVILRFEDILLKDTVVLKTSWATEAAYCLLDTKQVQGGCFRRQDLENIWADDRFEGKHSYLLNLMERFELIFRFQESERYIVPEGLPIDSPAVGEEKEKPTLRFEYHYDFMPKAILSRFICRAHQYIKGELFWRYGVVLEYEKQTYAQVELNDVAEILHIRVWGKSAEILLAIIRSHIEHIHQTLKNPPLKEKVPCVCSECKENEKPYLHEYRVLLKFHERNKMHYPCAQSTDDVSIVELLQGFAENRNIAHTQNALQCLGRADFAGYFASMDKAVQYFPPISNLATQYAVLCAEYMHGNIPFDFKQKLMVFAGEVEKVSIA